MNFGPGRPSTRHRDAVIGLASELAKREGYMPEEVYRAMLRLPWSPPLASNTTRGLAKARARWEARGAYGIEPRADSFARDTAERRALRARRQRLRFHGEAWRATQARMAALPGHAAVKLLCDIGTAPAPAHSGRDPSPELMRLLILEAEWRLQRFRIAPLFMPPGPSRRGLATRLLHERPTILTRRRVTLLTPKTKTGT